MPIYVKNMQWAHSAEMRKMRQYVEYAAIIYSHKFLTAH